MNALDVYLLVNVVLFVASFVAVSVLIGVLIIPTLSIKSRLKTHRILAGMSAQKPDELTPPDWQEFLEWRRNRDKWIEQALALSEKN